MVKRVIIVHRRGVQTDADWYEWLKDELEEKGFSVDLPEMPETGNPEIKSWIEHLDETVKKADKETYFVGHSIGCQTIMRYLESAPEKTKIGGAVFVAPWFNLKSMDSKDSARPWITKKINLAKVKGKIGKLIAFFSDNDTQVPLSEAKLFKDTLGAKIIVEKNQGHFTGEDGVHTPDTILEELLKIMGNK